MPICASCRDAADNGDILLGLCPSCNRRIGLLGNGRVRFHRLDGERCPGTAEPAPKFSGHDHCDGCPCQHRPSGSWATGG